MSSPEQSTADPAIAVYRDLASLRATIREERQRTLTLRLKLLLLLFRVCGYALFHGGALKRLAFPLLAFYKFYSEYLLGIELPPKLKAGPGLSIFHGYGLVVHRDARIGARCLLRQGVCIGNVVSRDGRSSGLPEIGDDVEFGVHAVAIGALRIGSRARIGACTVVTKDVPPDCSVVGAPMRVIPHPAAPPAQD